ncbi:MAG TPA: membrane dipeptidase [Anaerolineaceae bacterium]|nr:membrane dipeptidase [Anaerolineaceae bacterium]
MATQDDVPTSMRVLLGGDYWDAAPTAPLWGFADTHAHLMAHLAFGGEAFWGEPYDPSHPGAEGMEYALRSCEPIHGGLIDINPEFGHPASGGHPEYVVWPRFTTLVHQQAYIDWIYRAYQGGLRLITCLAVNNELLATKTSPNSAHDDRNAIQIQIAAIKQMADWVNTHADGAGKGWMQIVYSPDEAQKVISENRLAVILGMEVDSLGNWRKFEDLEILTGGNLELARGIIGRELDWLYSLGIRQITPIHLTNNAFGGTAIYLRFLETINLFVNGERWDVEDAWETGVRYRLDADGDDLVDDLERAVAISGRKYKMHRRTLVDHIPGVYTMYEAGQAPNLRGGHANARGLNQYGQILLEEMMARGLIIDVDHMSEKATDTALSIVEKENYPVICSHCWFRDLLYSADIEFDHVRHETYGTSDVHKVAHEAGKRGDQIERITRLGGIIAPIINQGDIAGLRRCMPELAARIPEPCAGSSSSWAQAYLYAVAKSGGRGVAIGTDINGAAGLPCPRFGPFAAYGVLGDERRIGDRRKEIERQTNGVAYTEPIRDYRWHRFESSLEGGYTDEEEDIWQAVAQYVAGFNPWIHRHPETDFPEPNVRQMLLRLKINHEQDFVDHVTKGFWAADLKIPVDKEQVEDWPVEQRAAYYAKRGMVELGQKEHSRMVDLIGKIKSIWDKWNEMEGKNRPLIRDKAGPRRDYDYNIDGMAHYGLLPDFLQDLCNIGLTAEDLAPLFRSAYDYIQMWATCEKKSAEISHRMNS